MAPAVHAPLERPPGPELGRLELLRLLRSRQLTSYLDRAAEAAPELAHFRIGREHAYLVGTPELVRELFGPLGRVGRKGRGLEQAKVLLGDGLLTSEGELHRRQRRLIQPAFHASRIGAYERSMRVAAAQLPERAGWADGAVRDVAADMAALTLRIVGETLFAADLTDDSTAVSESLAELLGRFQRVMIPGGALLNRVPLPSTRVLMGAIGELDAVVTRLIAEQRAGLGDDGTVLAMLLRARDEDGRPMPDRQVRDEVLTLMLAGHETTANALAWTWLLLDRNPAVADRLHAELDAVSDAAPAGALPADLPYRMRGSSGRSAGSPSGRSTSRRRASRGARTSPSGWAGASASGSPSPGPRRRSPSRRWPGTGRRRWSPAIRSSCDQRSPCAPCTACAWSCTAAEQSDFARGLTGGLSVHLAGPRRTVVR
jgi:cytochrome P450